MSTAIIFAAFYYRRLNDEFFSLPQPTPEDGYVLPYRFDEAKNICVRDGVVFSVGEENIDPAGNKVDNGGEYVLDPINNLVGYDRFLFGLCERIRHKQRLVYFRFHYGLFALFFFAPPSGQL